MADQGQDRAPEIPEEVCDLMLETAGSLYDVAKELKGRPVLRGLLGDLAAKIDTAQFSGRPKPKLNAADTDFARELAARGLSSPERRIKQMDLILDARRALEDAVTEYAEGAVGELEGNPLSAPNPLDPEYEKAVAGRLADLQDAVEGARSLVQAGVEVSSNGR